MLAVALVTAQPAARLAAADGELFRLCQIEIVPIDPNHLDAFSRATARFTERRDALIRSYMQVRDADPSLTNAVACRIADTLLGGVMRARLTPIRVRPGKRTSHAPYIDSLETFIDKLG